MSDDRLSLVNKLVRVYDSSKGVDNSGVVQFMYPNFIVKDDIFFDYDNNVIFTGKYRHGLKNELEHGTKNFIALCSSGVPDIDFTNKETIIRVFYNKWGKVPSEEDFREFDSMGDIDFWIFMKKLWVTGYFRFDDITLNLFDLYKLFGKQRYDILQMYYRLREFYPDKAIFSGTLSFLEKAVYPERFCVGGYYQSILNTFSKEYKDKVPRIIKTVYSMKARTSSEKEYRTFCLLMSLGKGNII